MPNMPTSSKDAAASKIGSQRSEGGEAVPSSNSSVEMTNHIDEGCELQQLVVDDDEVRGGVTPPVSPCASPTTPVANSKHLGRRYEYERIPTFDDDGIQVSTSAGADGELIVNQVGKQNQRSAPGISQSRNHDGSKGPSYGFGHGSNYGNSQGSSLSGNFKPNPTLEAHLVEHQTVSQGTSQGASQGSLTSRSLSRIATAPSMTTAGNAGQNTRLLYVNEKLSRGPSLMSEHGGTRSCRERTEKVGHSAPRAQIKRGATSIGLTSTGSHSHLSHLLPSRSRLPGADGRSALRNRLRDPDRSCQHHCFLTDVTDVHRMEEALLHLLEDFHSGKLRAFGKDCSMEQMTGIREQQERLARLHFDLGAQGELFPPLSDEGLRAGQENMQSLMGSLERLSVSIERLHSFSESRESSQQPD